MAGSPERAAAPARGGRHAGGARRAASSSAQRSATWDMQDTEDHAGRHSPLRSLVFSPPLYLRAGQAAEMGKKEHSTVRLSSCPGHPCQVLTKT